MAPIFYVSIAENKKVVGFYNKAMKELIQFYEINWCDNIPKIHLVPDRKTFDALKGRKTEDWVVGTTLGSKSILYILDPASYESESNHKYSDEEYFRLIKHELSHLFQSNLFDSFQPVWFTEGIAIYTSGQLSVKRKPKEFTKFLDFYSNGGSGVYEESGFAVEILINKLGKKKFLKVLRDLETPVTRENFKRYFEKNLGINLTYTWFNKSL